MPMKIKDPGRRGRRPYREGSCKRGGFLLIEVVLAMAILVLVTVGLYQIMRASITAAEEIRRSKHRAEQLSGLVELVRRSIETMPNEAGLTSSVREGTAGYSQALTIAEAPNAFAFGRGSAHYGPKSLILIPQVGGLASVAIEYEADPEARNPAPQGEEPLALVLLRDVRGIEWLFYDEQSASWMEKWENQSQRPGLVRMNLALPGEEVPYSSTFRVPKGGGSLSAITRGEGARGEDTGTGGQPESETTTPALRITQ